MQVFFCSCFHCKWPACVTHDIHSAINADGTPHVLVLSFPSGSYRRLHFLSRQQLFLQGATKQFALFRTHAISPSLTYCRGEETVIQVTCCLFLSTVSIFLPARCVWWLGHGDPSSPSFLWPLVLPQVLFWKTSQSLLRTEWLSTNWALAQGIKV